MKQNKTIVITASLLILDGKLERSKGLAMGISPLFLEFDSNLQHVQVYLILLGNIKVL